MRLAKAKLLGPRRAVCNEAASPSGAPVKPRTKFSLLQCKWLVESDRISAAPDLAYHGGGDPPTT